MPKMGDLAAQDSYGDVDWSKMNQPFGQLLDPNPKLYDTKAGPIYQADINQAIDVAMGASGGGLATKGIKAYHSSPHDFEKFDLSKIGTGEGAQVYGHGLYFAENPKVSGQGGQYWNQFLSRFKGNERAAATELAMNKFDREASIANMQEQIAKTNEALKTGTYPEPARYGPSRDKYEAILRDQQARLKLLESGKPVGPRTYEVDINADPAHMLDWDKAISTQPHVEEALRRGGFVDAKWPYSGMQGKLSGTSLQPLTSGEDAYRALGIERMGRNTPTPVLRRAATEALSEAGIPGIKYLDQGSRGAGTGSSNYVIFDPAIIDIMKKYGIAGAAPAAMGALAAQDTYQPEEKM